MFYAWVGDEWACLQIMPEQGIYFTFNTNSKECIYNFI